MKEITFEQFPLKDQIASYNVLGKFSPAVMKRDDGYCIRIIKGKSFLGSHTTMNWDYFDLDDSGMITTSPRGMAKQFNRKIRITDIAEAVEEYKETVINQ